MIKIPSRFLTEQTIDPSNSEDVANALRIGRESEVRFIIVGDIRRRLINGKTGIETIVYLYDTERNLPETIKLEPIIADDFQDREDDRIFLKNIADKISVEFPLLISKVVSIEKDIIVTDMNHPKLKKNTRLVIFDKKNGEVKGYARLINSPMAKILKGTGTIKVGDGVMTE